MPDRYAGRPFLKLVDSYVLSLIGELDPATAESLERMAPKLNETYGLSGATWQEVVRSQLHLPPDTARQIVDGWFAEPGDPDPVAWSQFVADQMIG
ncbi:hypothetical protein ABZS29_10700 [Kribbella sp. NPDC005582]|uniref:hypothetical protein n=1 Tax=Kribbella sp. NPDC005582 TaxID=3156893 RepID=UPI0033BAAFDC